MIIANVTIENKSLYYNLMYKNFLRPLKGRGPRLKTSDMDN